MREEDLSHFDVNAPMPPTKPPLREDVNDENMIEVFTAKRTQDDDCGDSFSAQRSCVEPARSKTDALISSVVSRLPFGLVFFVCAMAFVASFAVFVWLVDGIWWIR